HRRARHAAALDKMFRLETPRTISDDWVVRYDNRFFQLERQSRHYAPAEGQVVVCEAQDGSLAIEYRGPRSALAGDSAARPAERRGGQSRRPPRSRSGIAPGQAEGGAAAGPPVATGGASSSRE